ncbi:unnamed protein product, partial [marine sediment metagenome]
MIGALIFLALIIAVIMLMVKIRGQRKRLDKIEDKVY